ncbi:hypothetical protein IT40_04040 [Paracoccus versutus]|nr:hypothetical protein IT40_04040 [Paracoccus versutus]
MSNLFLLTKKDWARSALRHPSPAIVTEIWVFPDPVLPTSTTLRCWLRNSSLAKSRASVSLISTTSNSATI